jgi:hypothetical protein
LTHFENILAMPNILEKDNANDLELKINNEMPENEHFRVVRYDY